jgi:hypothetical protein
VYYKTCIAVLHFPGIWTFCSEARLTEAATDRVAVQDAVHCHFDEGASAKVIRLHFVGLHAYPANV